MERADCGLLCRVDRADGDVPVRHELAVYLLPVLTI